MMKKPCSHILSKLTTVVLAGLACLVSVSCATAQNRADPDSEFARNGRVLFELDWDTLDLKIVRPTGVRPCQLCTAEIERKYGSCEAALKSGINVCLGLVDATVQGLATITLIRSKRNPQCITISRQIIGGDEQITQVCRCLPTDSPGTCPAPYWIQVL
jgi:hypothetical protein